jgi:hypothetical protein
MARNYCKCLTPRSYRCLEYFIRGSNPVMDAMEGALISIGAPASPLNTERFDMV